MPFPPSAHAPFSPPVIGRAEGANRGRRCWEDGAVRRGRGDGGRAGPLVGAGRWQQVTDGDGATGPRGTLGRVGVRSHRGRKSLGLPLWSLLQTEQIRTKARGNEYQPNNRKRKRTHGWIKRISTPAGIEVILRRMLKGRKSLTH
uniref:Large ribosomal subunit protein bL34m n=1 Tax=Phasianus colchicus TaxID=9054 RepID=A0A669QM19_PHACC